MKIISNLAISLDGKISSYNRSGFMIGSKADHQRMDEVRALADAILLGGETLRSSKVAAFSGSKRKSSRKPILNIILSKNLAGIDPSWSFFQSSQVDRILAVTAELSKKRRKEFENSSEILLLRKKTGTPIAPEIKKILKERGVKTLLIEGGGSIMWEFVKENLIDELYITLVPRIIGGRTSPTLVDGQGFLPEEFVNLELKSVMKKRSELFLVYRRLKTPGKKHPHFT